MQKKPETALTRKGEIKQAVDWSISVWDARNFEPFIIALHTNLLTKKVKFPLLEYAASIIISEIPTTRHLEICNAIATKKSMGGYVIIGILLQNYATQNLKKSIAILTKITEDGAAWYITDILGERVLGVAMLRNFKQAFTEIKLLAGHHSFWVVRSIGPGAHYAIKKGLPLDETRELFKLLLRLGNETDLHIKTGIGWAAKTSVKFHPQLATEFNTEIQSTGTWFQSKIKVGLSRHAHATKSRSKKYTQ